MASVDGSKTLHAGSDEIYTNSCDPCHYDGTERKAVRYCQDCQEKLCSSCTESHKKFKSSRNHVVVAIEDMAEDESAAKGGRDTILCACGQSLVVSHFCENHFDVICNTCKTVKHRKCETAVIQKKSIGYTLDRIDKVLDRALKLKSDLEKFKKDRSINVAAFEESKENCLKEIRKYREEIKAIFDQFETNLCNEVQQVERQIKEDSQLFLNTSSATEKLIESDMAVLDDVKTVGRKDQMFSADIRITSHLKELEAVFEDLKSETKKPVEINFKRNEKLGDMLCNVQSIGRLKFNEKHFFRNFKSDENPQGVMFGNKKVTTIEKKDISYRTDKKTPWITGCAVLPRGKGMLVCDFDNNAIKHLDAHFNIINCIHLSKPWNIEAFCYSEAVITQPSEKKIQIIEVDPQLQISEPGIKFDRQCWGIAVNESDIIVSFHDAPGNGIIHVIDRNGVLKRVLGTELSLEGPSYISVPLTSSPLSGKLYISDFKKGSLFCITLYDKPINEYKSSDLTCVGGIYVDDSGVAIVCGRSTNNMYAIDSDGTTHRTMLLANKAIPKPRCVGCYYDHIDSKMKVIVGVDKSDSLYNLTLE